MNETIDDRREAHGASGGPASGGELADLAGRYLTFNLAKETYGANILKVREIIGMQDITRVPDTASYLKGVINLRGQVIAVMDLRLRFGMEEAPQTEETCIIILEANRVLTGAIVDRVQEVLDFVSSEIEPPPQFDAHSGAGGHILGMGKAQNRIVILLDTDAVVATRISQMSR